MNSFLIQCKVRKAELLQFLGMTAGGYLIGLIVVFIVMNVEKGSTCATAGTMLAVIAFAFMHLFGITISFMGDFNMAISLGATRKSLVAGYVLFNLLEIAVLEVEIILFGMFEKFMLKTAFPQASMEIDLTTFFTWKYLLGTMVVFTVLEMFFGAVILRYGMKVLWILWALWMLVWLMPMIIEKNEKLSSELAKLGLFLGGTLTPQGMVVLVIVLTIVVAAITWNILRKQRVTA
ncbi:MAG: hypothetical protein ACOCN3_03855 [Roseburia inulinivorans]